MLSPLLTASTLLRGFYAMETSPSQRVQSSSKGGQHKRTYQACVSRLARLFLHKHFIERAF